MLAAGQVMPLFIGSKLAGQTHLIVGLSRVMFPVVLLLGAERPARGDPAVLRPLHDPGDLPGGVERRDHRAARRARAAIPRRRPPVYAYAIAILAATGVQLLMAFGALGRIDFRLQVHIDWHDPRIGRVFR